LNISATVVVKLTHLANAQTPSIGSICVNCCLFAVQHVIKQIHKSYKCVTTRNTTVRKSATNLQQIEQMEQ